MNWELILTAFISATMGALTPILVARYSKTKQERDGGLVYDFLKIADMTGAQLERKINQVDRLEKEIEVIKASRAKRDIETQAERDALEARIKADAIDSRDCSVERAESRKQISKLENTVINMGAYIDTMKTALQKAGIDVPLNGQLMESVRRLQLSINERERLKAGK